MTDRIAGIKLTHDAAVAVIRGQELECAVEMEKTGNRPRYSCVERLEQVGELLSIGDLSAADIGTWVVDGWFDDVEPGSGDPAAEIHQSPHLISQASGQEVKLPVATYRELDPRRPIEGLSVTQPLPGIAPAYRSHHHSTGHLAGGFCASPFARQCRLAAVMVWDGGVGPRLYVVDPASRTVRSLGAALPLKGNAYVEVVSRFAPFRLPDGADIATFQRHQLSAPGKAMAYAGLGSVRADLQAEISARYTPLAERTPFVQLPILLADEVEVAARKLDASGADAIATWQAFLGDLLERQLASLLTRHQLVRAPLILTGGCALNITWNAQIRDGGRFGEVWVPPFPNDSGSAIGAACAELMRTREQWVLEWDVYSGPALRNEGVPPGWAERHAGPGEVASLLSAGVPVMIMLGRAELGPRALGHRSIFASATDRAMLDRLNAIKHREPYRPIAPICLEERASDIFDPGGCDPFMLFQHKVRPAWRDRVPAICHVDGTARLQTVSREQEPIVHELLCRYRELTGIPVLCNTSANLPGRGFFPSTAAALDWGGVDHLWTGELLYSRVF